VLGGAKRVGRAIVLALARGGCDVDFSYNNSRADADRTAADVEALGVECGTWPLALDDPKGAWSRADEIANSTNRWDVVVLCASAYEPSPFESVKSDALARAMAVNAFSPALVLQNFVPGLRNSTLKGGGCVVTMCDIHAMGETGRPRKGFLAYSMSKAALLEMTLVLARELAPSIRVNGVAPGVVAWPEKGADSDADAQAKYLSRVPLERAGTPEDAAEAVRWLALEATYCTGQIVRLDGGRSLA
jgi:pteridine reductase